MATLSKKIYFTAGTWQLVSANAFVGQKEGASTISFCNADSLPSGDVPESQSINSSDNMIYPKPIAGSIYARITVGTAAFRYYEI